MPLKTLLTVCLFHSLTTTAVRAVDDDLAKGRSLLWGGKYAEAAEVYAPLAEKDPAAALGLARALDAQGKTEDAVKCLSAAAEGEADLQAEWARLAFQRGDYEEAKTRSDEAIRLQSEHLLAGWIRAELARVTGRLDEAERGYARLISFYNNHDIDRAESLRWIGLAATRYARWNRLSGQFHFLVNQLYPEALQLEPKYWPAHYEAGLLFLEKYNGADATSELRAALELNPNAAEVHVALAELAVDRRDVEQADASIARALEINPRLLSAWLGKADLAWANFDVPETIRLLQEKALPLNPVDESALGRLAACYFLADGGSRQGASDRLRALIEEVTQRNPRSGEFFYALGMQLMVRNQHRPARRFLLEAIEKMPQKVGPRSQLGLLSMRTGDEAAARKLLNEAFEIDPFNIRVKNTLEVLEVLDSMETLETEHVVLRYDGRHDALLARYAAARIEALYPEWSRRFGSQPAGKPLLEIFNQARGQGGHQWFSTRMTGLPHLGPVAASTGWLVAMASPNELPAQRRFNWCRVLKHELAHVFTLQYTRFNIPHWYTEGLSVYSEGSPRPQPWNALLARRVPAGELFDLQTLNFAFARPQSSDDWLMAYCQAELYVEYMLQRWGSGRQRKLLAAYREGLTTADAIRRAFGVSQTEFERGYVEYLKQLVAEMPILQSPSRTSLTELLEARRARPDDVEAAAELAYAYLLRKAHPEAREAAEAALATEPNHQLATYVLARLAMQAGKTQEAAEMLQHCLDENAPQPNVLQLLAALKLKAEQYDEAARLYALGERLDAVDLRWTRSLARVYLLAENETKLGEVLARLARDDADDLTARKKLAQMALERHQFPEAADWASQAIDIDVMDAEMHWVLGEASAGANDYARAVAEFEVAVELAPDEPHRRLALADAYVQANQPDEARQTLKALLELSPDYPGAELLLESLEETEP
ncbi:MAG: tetratricopeptide repeat protein [Pirellulales bacterium]|nr:tetratricopeptide repeat protein [Pirellulales bacterium]